MPANLGHLLLALGINSVPAMGWFFGGWSPGTTLLVYWFENVAGALLIAARLARHRAVTDHAGHFKYRGTGRPHTTSQGSFLSHFLRISLVFSGAHGIFLFAILGLLYANGKTEIAAVSWQETLSACGMVAALLALDFFLDWPRLRGWAFADMEALANRNLGRMAVVHLTLIFGMAAVAWSGHERAFFGVFVALKTLNDLSMALPQWNPERPPRWLCAVMDKIPAAKPGQSFEEFWIADKHREIERRKANERPLKTSRLETA